jgi:hypothetical protein
MLLITAFSQMHLTSMDQQAKRLRQQNSILEKQMSGLELQLSRHRKDPQLEKQLTKVNNLLLAKEHLHQRLTDHGDVLVSGFSMVMKELSQYHHPAISLEAITISPNEITLSGQTKDADIVPLWLSGFDQSRFLADKRFSQLQMQFRDNQALEFVVSSGAKQANLEPRVTQSFKQEQEVGNGK